MTTELGVRRLLAAAGQAPSVLNTQPWRLDVVRHEFVELLADPDRRLRVSDPRGRSQHVSCGAALFNLRLAVRAAGFRPVVWLLPGGQDEPHLLAAVRAAEAPGGRHGGRELYELIWRRRTNREPFSAEPVPPDVLAGLRIAASREGANLVLLDRAGAEEVLDQAATADDELTGDHDYQAELAAWTTPGPRHDGLPPYVRGPRPAGEPVPVRSFGRRAGSARFERHPQIAVLTTPGDRPVDWLRAGQALQRMLLVATLHGVSASFLNQPLDLRDMRGRRDPRHRRGHPQMIIRLGYGPYVARAPRRPARELEISHV
ncbi:nitroreductase family protein [Nonomuraea rhodomycinica]|uniref:Nitroreductase family protein n=2 Tax=Nonomuraea rhodomycinica TaxID=1712872 RepID=A0A7Y6IU65_9ACTN|nr:nitroreductase family protein [Nonomuraea rhodomycinica]